MMSRLQVAQAPRWWRRPTAWHPRLLTPHLRKPRWAPTRGCCELCRATVRSPSLGAPRGSATLPLRIALVEHSDEIMCFQ